MVGKSKSRGIRDAKGQFVAGAPGISPGRPARCAEELYLSTFRSSLPQKKWGEIVKAFVRKAAKGDHRAFELLCKFCLPTPQQRLRIESNEEEEVRIGGLTAREFEIETLKLTFAKMAERNPEAGAMLKAAKLLD